MTADIKFSWFEKHIHNKGKIKAHQRKYINKLKKGSLIVMYSKSLNIPFDDNTWMVF